MGNKGKSVLWGCVLAWVIPGGGHWYAGHRGRGALLFVLVSVIFLVGVSACMPGEILPPGPETNPEASWAETRPIIAAWAGENVISLLSFLTRLGAGIPCFLALALGWGNHDTIKPLYEVGCVYTAVAGTLNLLLIFRARDILAKEEEREKEEAEEDTE